MARSLDIAQDGNETKKSNDDCGKSDPMLATSSPPKSRNHPNSTPFTMNDMQSLSTCFVTPIQTSDLQESLRVAYGRLTQCELILFLSLRGLPTKGSAQELVRQLVKFDLEFFRGVDILEEVPALKGESSEAALELSRRRYPKLVSNGGFGEHDKAPATPQLGHELPIATNGYAEPNGVGGNGQNKSRAIERIPPELWSEIFEHVGDWELATAFKIRTNLERPWDWEDATKMDLAILSGDLEEIKELMEKSLGEPHDFTEAGGDVMVRWGYIEVLDYFFHNSYRNFLSVFQRNSIPPNEVALRMEIPWLASRYGQTKVLDWWLANSAPLPPGFSTFSTVRATDSDDDLPPLYRKYDEGALNQASWKGHIHVLQWWKDSGLPLRIGDVMDWGTIGGHISVLEWWKHSGENTNIMHRDALCIASTRGKIEFLEWFRNSGLQLTYGNDILAIITKKNKPQSLEWWAKSGLRIEYAISDIWEAIEDATTKGDEARDWWVARGVTFDGLDPDEWMRLRVL